MNEDKSQLPAEQTQPQPLSRAEVNTDNPNDQGQAQHTLPDKSRSWRFGQAINWRGINWQLVFDFLLVIVTSIYTYYSSQQWTETRKLAKIGQEANNHARIAYAEVQRAFVTV